MANPWFGSDDEVRLPATERILALAQASGHLQPAERAMAFDISAAVAGSAVARSAELIALMHAHDEVAGHARQVSPRLDHAKATR